MATRRADVKQVGIINLNLSSISLGTEAPVFSPADSHGTEASQSKACANRSGDGQAPSSARRYGVRKAVMLPLCLMSMVFVWWRMIRPYVGDPMMEPSAPEACTLLPPMPSKEDDCTNVHT